MSWSFRTWLASLNPHRQFAHPPTSSREVAVPTSRKPVSTPPAAPDLLGDDCVCRMHRPARVSDGDAAASVWAWSDEGHGYVIEGLPALDWRGRPAGVSLETLRELHPNASAVSA